MAFARVPRVPRVRTSRTRRLWSGWLSRSPADARESLWTPGCTCRACLKPQSPRARSQLNSTGAQSGGAHLLPCTLEGTPIHTESTVAPAFGPGRYPGPHVEVLVQVPPAGSCRFPAFATRQPNGGCLWLRLAAMSDDAGGEVPVDAVLAFKPGGDCYRTSVGPPRQVLGGRRSSPSTLGAR